MLYVSSRSLSWLANTAPSTTTTLDQTWHVCFDRTFSYSSCILPHYSWSRQVLSLFGLLQVTGCVNITWFIGFDKSCSLSYFFFLAHSDRVSSRKPCLHPDLLTSSELASLCAPADPNHQGQRCALVCCQDGNGDCGCQWVCCLPWLEITAQVEVRCMRYSGRWCGFDAGW